MPLLGAAPPARRQQAFMAPIQGCGFFQISCWYVRFESWRVLLHGVVRSADKVMLGGGHVLMWHLMWGAAAAFFNGAHVCHQQPTPALSSANCLSGLFVSSSAVEFSVSPSRIRYWEWVKVTKPVPVPDGTWCVVCRSLHLDVTVSNLLSCLMEA